MNLLHELRNRFRPAIEALGGDAALAELVHAAGDARHGDYQADCAMPLKKLLALPPRDIAAQLIGAAQLDDLCQPPEIAGPGFINLRLRDDWLAAALARAARDPRMGVPLAAAPRTFVIDFSSPNVAKELHVGHIRSTVIGDALCRLLRFLGHRVISDNHLGDWGTQFGMIIYGYKHFVDQAAYGAHPVGELTRLYKLVRKLMSYHESSDKLAALRHKLANKLQEIAELSVKASQGDAKAGKALAKAQRDQSSLAAGLADLEQFIASVEGDAALFAQAQAHPDIAQAVLEETVKLHAGDAENLRLWEQFLPQCHAEIDDIYERLGVRFDHSLGESFYRDQLAGVVADLQAKGLTRESDGAECLFLEGFESPMLIRKRDGAFLYATTDLATIQYRMRHWQPDAILYVVDARQAEHFGKLFAAARLWGYDRVELQHVGFGMVLGQDGRPYRTREGEAVALDDLLTGAIAKAHAVVSEIDDAKPQGAELAPETRRQVAEVIGLGAIKYGDLSHHRSTDYMYDEDAMVALKGNTVTYIQYSYARVKSIWQKGGVDRAALLASGAEIELVHPAERALALQLVRFSETLAEAAADYRPNVVTSYLYELAGCYAVFFENCPVLKAETPALRDSRLLLCDLTARTIQQGLDLLGIGVIERM